jgi:ABC-type dipeptide/oligopeptide/nickel transport system permease subunit
MKKLNRAGINSRKFPAIKSPQLLLGIILSGFVLTITFVSFFWTPWDPLGINVEDRLLPPNLSHWFGTDRLGRDLFSQIMVGSQNTLFVALISTIIGAVLGTSLGLAAAGSGPRLGAVITRISDIGIALPSILIALVLATTLGPGRLSVIIAISFWFVPVTARVVVGPARQILALDFVEAAFSRVGLDWKSHVEVDRRYLRPTEVDSLIGDPSKIQSELSWKAKTHWKELAELMVDADLADRP